MIHLDIDSLKVSSDTLFGRIALKRRGIYPQRLKLYKSGEPHVFPAGTPFVFRAFALDVLVAYTPSITYVGGEYSFDIDTRTSEVDAAFSKQGKVYARGEFVWSGGQQSESLCLKIEPGFEIGGENVSPSPLSPTISWENIAGVPLSFPPESLDSYDQLLALPTTPLPLIRTIRYVSNGMLEMWQLVGHMGDAESAFLKKPNDYNLTTNAKVWIRIS